MAMDDPLDHIVNIEEGEEEALDAALDMELAATYVKYPVPHVGECAEHASEKIAVVAQGPGTSELSFSFPGWEIGISKGAKRKMPSISRHTNDPQAASSKRGKQVNSTDTTSSSTSAVASQDPSAPVDGCPADGMDDELLACIFMKLNVRDLCASMRSCKRWHRVACKEDVWEHIPLPPDVPGALPRWMKIRNNAMSMELRTRFQVFRRGYEFVRSALTAWWDHGKPDGQYPSAMFRSLIQKLVINDWSLLYEAFGAAFSDRADHVAVIILAAVQTGKFLIPYTNTDGDSNVTGNREETFEDELEVEEIWTLVLSLWRQYKKWLMLVVSHCPELNHEVMLERARSNALAMTPTVYGKGIICFRSQVILKYGIRHVLQTTWSRLASAKRSGVASDNQLDLFRSADHLFQETSVLDDLTLSPATFTQQKLKRCFGNEISSKTKPRVNTNSTALSTAEAEGLHFERMAMMIKKS